MKRRFEDAEMATVARLYSQVTLAVDQLPYTDEFDWLHGQFNRATGTATTKAELFRFLTNLRKKKGFLPKKPR